MVTFVPIPDTDLEIASHGRSHNRVVFIRQKGTVKPLDVADDVRVVLIGDPEVKLRHAMSDGRISRSKLAELVDPVSGNTYHKLRVYIDRFVR